MEQEVDFISDTKFANTLRLYTTDDQQGSLIDYAIRNDGLNVIPSVYLTNPNSSPNDRTVASWTTISNNPTVMGELNNLVTTLENLPDSDFSSIPFIVIGNEAISQVGGWSDTDIESAIEYVKSQLQQRLPSSIFSQLKFTTAENYADQYINIPNDDGGLSPLDYLYNPANAPSYTTTSMGLSSDINVIYANINPYLDGISVSQAANYVDTIYQELQHLYPKEEIVISETGWPSEGATVLSQVFTSPQQSAVPNLENEQTFWQNFLQIANQQNISFGAFEAFNEPNKVISDPMNQENNWGLISTNSGLTYTSSTFKTAIKSLLAPVTSNPGLLGGLSINQQLELIYIAYFNRAADGAGFAYWVGQNATIPLTGIANLFAPQAETIALYPFLASFLSTPNPNLNTPTAQSGLTGFVNSVYQNMFGHAADSAGAAYWLNQITSGAVGLGAAALSIANGASGTDATEVQNKIMVALDFTNRTNAAGLTGTGSSSTSLLAAARNVLSGVNGTSLNDASVTAGENATTTYISATAQPAVTTLVSFNGTNGDEPLGNLVADSAGNLFGTTDAGGTSSAGTVFEIARTATGYAGTPTTLVSFNETDGANPQAGLVIDANGDLFGTTSWQFTGGTAFEIAKTAGGYASTPTTLVSFNGADGAVPSSTLIADANGDLFGTTIWSGIYGTYGWNGLGTVFEIGKTASGYASSPNTLANFTDNPGAYPTGTLVADAAGDLFGTTDAGGPDNSGTVFEIAKTATGYANPTTLVGFEANTGIYAQGSLIIDAAGDLIGMTAEGGVDGTVYEIAKTATGYASNPTILVTFNGADGDGPDGGLIMDANGNLFGTTSAGGANNDGTVFEIPKTASGYGTLTTLLSFNGANGANPGGTLIADANGDLFGTTTAGGASSDGTAFEVTDSGFKTSPSGTSAAISSIASSSSEGVISSAVATSPADPSVITISGSDQVTDPGAGSYTIQFLTGASADTLILHANGVDQISGFDPTTDVLDLSSLLSETNVNLNGDISALSNYLTIADQGSDAFVNFDPSGQGGGSAVAVLQGLGNTVTNLSTLVEQGAVRIA